MVLCGNQLQCRLCAGTQSVMSHINHNLFPFCGSDAQGLPSIQAAKAQMGVSVAIDARTDLHNIVKSLIQQAFCIIQFSLQSITLRMIFSALLIPRIQAAL